MGVLCSIRKDREISWFMILVRYLSTTLAGSLISLSGIPSGPVALFALSDLAILFASSLEAGGKSKLKESGIMMTTLGWFS